MIRSFRHKGLERFFLYGSKAGIQAVHASRLRLQLGRLDAAAGPGDMDLPGWRLHPLKLKGMAMSKMHNPPHPGEVLRDTVLAEISVTEFARRLGVSRVALSRVINGRAAVSAEMAIRLAAALGGGAESWMRMQAAFDLWQASKRRRPKIIPLKLAA